MFVAFIFSKDALNQVRVSYRHYRHPGVLASLTQQYGRPIVTDRPDINDGRMLIWLQTGTLAASKDVSGFDESVVLWSRRKPYYARSSQGALA